MLLTEFPNIHWLKAKIKENFSDRRGLHNLEFPHPGWPSIVLHTNSQGTERREVKGPFSLFLNLEGQSIIQAGKQSLKIETDHFACTNFGQYYDLIIPKHSHTPATTFNIHFGEKLYYGTISSLQNSHIAQLDQPEVNPSPLFNTFVRSRFRDETFNRLITQLQQYYAQIDEMKPHDEEEDSLLSDLLIHLVGETEKELKGAEHISSLKASTRLELLRRIFLSIDYMHENYQQTLSIDQLSQISCLSKFHYLRTFKEAIGCTPRQYWHNIRMRKAQALLRSSKWPIYEISHKVGFEEPNSFSRFFQKHHQMSPIEYRRTYQ